MSTLCLKTERVEHILQAVNIEAWSKLDFQNRDR